MNTDITTIKLFKLFGYTNYSIYELFVQLCMQILIQHPCRLGDHLTAGTPPKSHAAPADNVFVFVQVDNSIAWIISKEKISTYMELKTTLHSQTGKQKSIVSQVRLVLERYLEFGNDRLHQAYESHDCLIYCRSSNPLILCRDHIGDQKLYYSLTHLSLQMATNEAAIIPH